MRKPDPIDIVKLYAQSDHQHWNRFLTACYKKQDIDKLCRTRTQLQAGMAIAAKRKLNTEGIILFFIRLQNSIENTIKKIIKEKNPNPCDNPLTAEPEHKHHKTNRDTEIERHLRRTGY